MTVAIAILMKDPCQAKTRLKPALGNDARETLALLLFENTLGFFRRFYGDNPLAVVTPSERVAEIARAHDATALGQNGKAGINGAAAAPPNGPAPSTPKSFSSSMPTSRHLRRPRSPS